MPISEVVHGGGASPKYTRRVYYTGTDTLYEGYALCYNYDAYDVSAENLDASGWSLDLAVSEPCPARAIQVEKPSINNCAHFAGVVSEKSDSVTGPAWIEINLPGSVCNIWANANCDHGSSGTGMNSGQSLTFTQGQYYFKYTGVPGEGSALVLQDVDRSTTAGRVMARLMTGPPSGGYQIVNSTHFSTEQAVSAGGAVCVAPFGVTGVVSTAFTTAALTAALTANLTGSDAEWLGQIKRFELLTSVGANGFVVTISQGYYANSSALQVATPVSHSASLVSDEHSVTCQWDGTAWVFRTNSSVIGVA